MITVSEISSRLLSEPKAPRILVFISFFGSLASVYEPARNFFYLDSRRPVQLCIMALLPPRGMNGLFVGIFMWLGPD